MAEIATYMQAEMPGLTQRDGADTASEAMGGPSMEVLAWSPPPGENAAQRSEQEHPQSAPASRPPEPPVEDALTSAPPTPPSTVGEALALAHSDGAKALLRLAASIATETQQPTLDAWHLLLALLVTGQHEPRAATAAPWLHAWILERTEKPIAVIAPYLETKPTLARRDMPLTPYMSAVLARASTVAWQTVQRRGYDLRHIAVALTLPDTNPASSAFTASVRSTIGVDLSDFTRDLIERITTSRERNESVRAWRRLAAAPPPSPALNARSPSVTTLAGFSTDRPSNTEDSLGIDADVTAFARLICLEEARPPLSIGIFGEWGSGKSSFMESLQLKIADLTSKTRQTRESALADQVDQTAKQRASKKPPRFIENVVQIRFNAWHYADANLWASLTAEFFDQLRRGGYEGQRSKDYLELIGKVAESVRSLEASAQKAEDKLAEAERAARHADEALASARKKLIVGDLTLASKHISETLDGIRKENSEKLKEVSRRIYRDDLGANLDSFSVAASEASTVPGKLALVARVVLGGGYATWLAVLSIVLVAAGGVDWRYGDPTSLAVLIQRAIAWGGGTLAALASLWQAVKFVKPVLDGAWAYSKAVEEERKKLAKEIEEKEAEARKAAGVLKQAHDEANETKQPLAKYGDGATSGAPSTILRYFLFEDCNVRDYDKQVGLVSRARRSFEQLDAIFGAKRDGLAAKDRQACLKSDETLNPKEIEALKRYESMQLDKQGLAIPDRIILYIDDLDRCTHEQVYDVLQAIHLLLAFELFVVVVGVDVRWVEEAVARRFSLAPENLSDSAMPTEHGAARQRADIDRRKRAIDYLEKIFQLPFWLRRLSTEGDKGGSYGVYVQDLLAGNLETTEAEQPGSSENSEQAGKAPETDSEANKGEVKANDVQSTAVSDAAAIHDPTSAEAALATVRLTKVEIDFLASPEIGAIAFKSPRSVKRMLNVYRIVRARMSEAELDEFLGRNGKTATWPIAALLAAIETGQSIEIADALYEIIHYEPERLLQVYLTSVAGLDSKPSQMPTGVFDAIKLVASSLPNLHRAIDKVQAAAGPSDALLTSHYLAMARIVRRYSFNRYH